MTSNNPEKVEVTQADRDAAAGFYLQGDPPGHMGATKVKQGFWDEHWFVQAFARHRQSAFAAGKAEGRREVDWQPFETAPRDGTEILVYREDAGVFTAHYVEEDAHLSSYLNPPEGDFYWFSATGEDLTNDMPTHWRPLPDGPALASIPIENSND